MGNQTAITLPPVLAYIMGTPSAPRAAVEETIQAAIDALDLIDGDPDEELNGDEADWSLGEDEFGIHGCNVGIWSGPGCPVSDPDMAVDDLACVD